MNIEDEQKAFDTWVMTNSMKLKSWFDVWIAAKAHAEEMAKPTCVIEPWAKYQTWSVKKPKGQAFRNIKLEFATADEAKTWAETNGYRIIE